MGIYSNSQQDLLHAQRELIDAVNGNAQQARVHAEERDRQRAAATHQAQLDASGARFKAASLSEENAKLKKELKMTRDEMDALKQRLDAQNEQKQMLVKELDTWMASQEAFRILFDKFGKMDDGRPASSLTSDELFAVAGPEFESAMARQKARRETAQAAKPEVAAT